MSTSTFKIPDMVFPVAEVRGPVAALPEAVPVHVPAAVAEWRVAVWSSLQVQIPQLLQVGPDDLREPRRESECVSWRTLA